MVDNHGSALRSAGFGRLPPSIYARKARASGSRQEKRSIEKNQKRIPLDIKNMFNAVSHERLQEINQRNSQLLNCMLTSYPNGHKIAAKSAAIMYVDDVNAVLHNRDVDYFLNRFKTLGKPLGAILNTKKTRIMTNTTGTSLVEWLKKHHNRGKQMLGHQLATTIGTFSTTKVNGLPVPVEVMDGLRVLGAPIGSLTFCQDFLLKALAKAQSDANKLLANLEDLQTPPTKSPTYLHMTSTTRPSMNFLTPLASSAQ
jgi:hypothetical protein